jgi:hypothetical protein
VQKTRINVKFRRKRENLLSLSELTKLRESSKFEVSKGMVPLFGKTNGRNLFGRNHDPL